MVLVPGRLTLSQLRRVARSNKRLTLDPTAAIAAIVARGEPAYGVNTGFGRLASTHIPREQLEPPAKDRFRLGLAFNMMARKGELSAPIVIGRDHLDTGSVASPNRETEGMADGTDAVSDWPLLNALLSTAGGATWVSLHHGGGVGMGYSQHAGLVIVADGTEAADRRLRRVLFNDPATGVMRHADAGYELARRTADEVGLDLPMLR